MELVLTEEQAKQEASRCLACGICSECHLCVEVCKREAIDHQQAPTQEEIEVGSVILSPGYSLYQPELSPELGYGRYANVVTSMEFERMLSASGPWGGHVSRRSSDHREPKKIAFHSAWDREKKSMIIAARSAACTRPRKRCSPRNTSRGSISRSFRWI